MANDNNKATNSNNNNTKNSDQKSSSNLEKIAASKARVMQTPPTEPQNVAPATTSAANQEEADIFKVKKKNKIKFF